MQALKDLSNNITFSYAKSTKNREQLPSPCLNFEEPQEKTVKAIRARKLEKIDDHVGKYHDINNFSKLPISKKVNSYHEFKLNKEKLPKNFEIIATDLNGEIESILDTAAKDGYRVGDLIHALVQSRLFLGGDSSQ